MSLWQGRIWTSIMSSRSCMQDWGRFTNVRNTFKSISSRTIKKLSIIGRLQSSRHRNRSRRCSKRRKRVAILQKIKKTVRNKRLPRRSLKRWIRPILHRWTQSLPTAAMNMESTKSSNSSRQEIEWRFMRSFWGDKKSFFRCRRNGEVPHRPRRNKATQ